MENVILYLMFGACLTLYISSQISPVRFTTDSPKWTAAVMILLWPLIILLVIRANRRP